MVDWVQALRFESWQRHQQGGGLVFKALATEPLCIALDHESSSTDVGPGEGLRARVSTFGTRKCIARPTTVFAQRVINVYRCVSVVLLLSAPFSSHFPDMAALSLSTSTIVTNIPPSRMTIRPLAAMNREYRMRVPFEVKQGQSRLFHKLPSGLNMEVIFQEGQKHKHSEGEKKVGQSQKNPPPLVFIHGSFHAAWCWAEHWLSYFSQNGYDCYAVSLLGQGESDAPAGPVAGTLQTHAGDVADFIQKELEVPPVLVGHSFGGLIVQYYIANMRYDKLQENGSLHPYLAGAVLVCSVPPSGNSGLVWRYLFSKPIAAYKVTRSLAAKAFQTSLPLCRETFFSVTMEDQVVLRYQKLMKESSRMPLFDLRKLNASLPVPSLTNSSLEVFVMGAKNNFIVVNRFSVISNKMQNLFRITVHSKFQVFCSYLHLH